MSHVEHQLLDVNGIQLSLYGAGPAQGRPVWLLHGFPECWHAWRHVIDALVAAGYRVWVPEMRGYGRSSAPEAVEAYDLPSLGNDILGAMDALGQARAAVIGHDWGAPVAWSLALRAPERVEVVGGFSVPYGGRPKRPATELLREAFGDRFNYILYFQTPGVAEAELDADIPRTLRIMLQACSAEVPKDLFLRDKPAGSRLFEGLADPEVPPAWCDDESFQHYLATFAGRGFGPALNWYRNFQRNWALSEPLAERRIEQPALFLIGDHDPVGTLEAHTLARMAQWVPRVEAHTLADCGHWLQGEKPAEVNARLLDFLARHYPVGGVSPA